MIKDVLKRLLPNKEDRDSSTVQWILMYPELLITGSYFVLTFFSKDKTIEFHRNVNPIRRLRINIHKKKEIENIEAFNKRFLVNGKYDFNGIYLPDVSNEYGYGNMMRYIYDDIFKIYVEYNDNYNWRLVDKIDKNIPEGVYCYSGKNGEDINIKPGYTVIDAGAWIGDFSAYAAKKGAYVYAFEPLPKNIQYLEKTAEYNGNIKIVPMGLGDKPSVMSFDEDANNTGRSKFSSTGNVELRITTIDQWVEQNSIKKIDFIKSDIEGFERNMLLGAKEVLKSHKPILSICTYHFPDDPQVLEEIILSANPDYKVIQRKMKLFAYVPDAN